ncbi:MAG: ABC transporter permease [Natronospirillum sp.]|uniref:ABC transporter permease n=1 Tax=Natronospirillum sp. TaxID=2812955 RepID=UPI0025D33591|nr:ABC transporter permease [Natronospirillum sp.]MCH8550673.1 ABC transporter permease [Natronospirillum sp.]
MLLLRLAWRNVLRNRRRTILTLLSMVGGYIIVTLVLSVNYGSYDQMLEQYTRDSIGHVQVTADEYLDRPRLQRTLPVDESLRGQLAQAQGVRMLTPRLESGALAYGEERSLPVEVRGVEPDQEDRLSRLGNRLSAGRYLNAEPDEYGQHEALIGARVARQLALAPGDDLVLIAQGADGSLANELYTVVGILGDTEAVESRWVVLPLAAAQDFYVLPDQAHRWIILGADFQRAERLAASVRGSLATDAQWADSALQVSPWQVVAREFYETMKADQQGGMIASYIIIFLVCIGVLNTILMSVMERIGEFGVLKAIGTPPHRLFGMIVLEALVLATLACALGFLLAWPINLWLTLVGIPMSEPIEVSGLYFSHFRGRMSWGMFAIPTALVWFTALLVALYPAIRAARLSPLDAMRRL